MYAGEAHGRPEGSGCCAVPAFSKDSIYSGFELPLGMCCSSYTSFKAGPVYQRCDIMPSGTWHAQCGPSSRLQGSGALAQLLVQPVSCWSSITALNVTKPLLVVFC